METVNHLNVYSNYYIINSNIITVYLIYYSLKLIIYLSVAAWRGLIWITCFINELSKWVSGFLIFTIIHL